MDEQKRAVAQKGRMKMEQENTQAVALKTEANGAVVWANSMIVACKEDADAAMSKLSQIKTIRKRWTNYWEPLKKAANESWKAIVAKEKEGTDVADEAERIAKGKVLAWQQAEARRAAAEQARLQAEADEKARKERDRLEKEAAKLKTPELRQERLEAAASIVAPVVTITAPTATAAGTSVRKTWKAELVDIGKLIEAAPGNATAASLLVFNEQAANAFARATKGNVAIPGVRFSEVESLSVRS
jgi:hypothetical protein